MYFFGSDRSPRRGNHGSPSVCPSCVLYGFQLCRRFQSVLRRVWKGCGKVVGREVLKRGAIEEMLIKRRSAQESLCIKGSAQEGLLKRQCSRESAKEGVLKRGWSRGGVKESLISQLGKLSWGYRASKQGYRQAHKQACKHAPSKEACTQTHTHTHASKQVESRQASKQSRHSVEAMPCRGLYSL